MAARWEALMKEETVALSKRPGGHLAERWNTRSSRAFTALSGALEALPQCIRVLEAPRPGTDGEKGLLDAIGGVVRCLVEV